MDSRTPLEDSLARLAVLRKQEEEYAARISEVRGVLIQQQPSSIAAKVAVSNTTQDLRRRKLWKLWEECKAQELALLKAKLSAKVRAERRDLNLVLTELTSISTSSSVTSSTLDFQGSDLLRGVYQSLRECELDIDDFAESALSIDPTIDGTGEETVVTFVTRHRNITNQISIRKSDEWKVTSAISLDGLEANWKSYVETSLRGKGVKDFISLYVWPAMAALTGARE